MNAIVRRSLRVARGARRGAEVSLATGRTWVIGSAADLCDVVLPDEGVAKRHCALSLDARAHVVCTALETTVWIGQRELPPGASVSMPDFLPLRCGQATLLVGPEGSDWSFSMVAAEKAPGWSERARGLLAHARAASPLAFGAIVMGSTVLVASSVWGAVSWLTAPPALSVDNLSRSQRWLLSVAPRGSELQLIADEARAGLVVSGYVTTERERLDLAAALARQRNAPRSEVVSVEDLLGRLAQVARLQSLACEPAYRGGGRAACANELADEAAAQRLRAAALAQVGGLRELTLEVSPPRVMAVAPTTAAPRRGPSSRKYAVLMSNKRGNQLVGPAGQRWREGDAFDGMTIRRIELDQVVFERGPREEVVLQLAQLDPR
jgi:hypothetical protein